MNAPGAPPAPGPTAAGPSRGVAVLVLAAVVFATLWPALFGSYLADDVRLIVRNPAVRDGDLAALLTQPMFDVDQGYWRPLTMLMLWLGDAVAGPFGAHALSLLLHLANACAVRALAARVLSPTAALWVAVVFAVHPVQVESACWCAAINDPLWSGAALQAMLCAARWRERGARGLPLGTALWVGAALLAKETGLAAIPLVGAALLWLPARTTPRGATPAPTPAAAGGTWGRVALALGAAVLLWLSLRALALGEPFGAVLLGAGIDPVTEANDLLRVPQLFTAQLALLVWPLPVLPARSVAPLGTGPLVALALGVALVAVVLWRLRRRLPPPVWLALALLVVPIAPTLCYQRVLGVYPIADRYAYLGVAGLALLLAHVPGLFARRWLAWLLPAAMAPVAFAASWLWYDAEHFAAHTVQHAPDDPMLLVMAADHELGKAYDGDGWARLRAQRLYERALAALGDDVTGTQPRLSLGRARLGLAWCRLLDRSARDDTATLAAFRAAVDAAPESASAWTGLGIALGEARRFADAAAAFEHALQLDPRHGEAQRALARLREVVPATGR